MNPEIFFNSMPKPTSPHLPISRSPVPKLLGFAYHDTQDERPRPKRGKLFIRTRTLATCQDAEVSTRQKRLSKLRPEEIPAHPPHLTSTPPKRVVPCPIPLPLPLSTRKPKHSPPLGCFHAHQTAVCVLHARRRVGAFAQTLQVSMTTVGKERGPSAGLRGGEVRTRLRSENMWREDIGSWPGKSSLQWMTTADSGQLSEDDYGQTYLSRRLSL